MLSWHIITRAQYDAGVQASTIKDDALYFLSDTKEIYKGSNLFTEAVVLYDGTDPQSKAIGKIYVNKTTLEGKVWNGTAWTTVIRPVQTSVASTNTTDPVTGKAVADYVAAEIAKVTGSGELVKSVEWDADTQTLTITTADDETEDITLEGLAVDLKYTKATGKLEVVDATGEAIGSGVNLDLERFISAAAYGATKKEIILAFTEVTKIDTTIYEGTTTNLPSESVEAGTIARLKAASAEDNTAVWYIYKSSAWSTLPTTDTPLVINVGDLVDTYTAENSKTVKLTVTGNAFKAEAIVSTTEGNQLKETDNGLFVAAYDDSKVMKLVEGVTTDGTVAVLGTNGQAKASTVTVGGATLDATAPATKLATEAAVAAVRDALQSAIDGKMNKVATGHEGEVLLAAADGQASLSSMKLGGATMKETPDAATLATEKAVETYVNTNAVLKTAISTTAPASSTAASDDKIMSEKLVAGMLEWKTTV